MSEYQKMRDCHIGRIDFEKHCIEVLHESFQLFYGVLYPAGPERRHSKMRSWQNDQVESHRTSANWMGSPHCFRIKAGRNAEVLCWLRKTQQHDKKFYPGPHKDQWIKFFEERTVVFSLDGNSGYGQAGIYDIHFENASIASHIGLYRCIRMKFGLWNAPGTFQHTVEIVVSSIKFQLPWYTQMTSSSSPTSLGNR